VFAPYLYAFKVLFILDKSIELYTWLMEVDPTNKPQYLSLRSEIYKNKNSNALTSVETYNYAGSG
jgi:hypothetical protein